MTTPQLGLVLHHVRLLTEVRPLDEVADGELIAQFVGGHDEAAFTALLRRHGPMVLRVCRQVLGRVQDAEDAFQATFLLLARKAERPKGRKGGAEKTAMWELGGPIETESPQPAGGQAF